MESPRLPSGPPRWLGGTYLPPVAPPTGLLTPPPATTAAAVSGGLGLAAEREKERSEATVNKVLSQLT